MAYDEELADRVREALAAAGADATEQAMFGGLAFMVGGHMTLGVVGNDLIVRVGPNRYEAALGDPSARPMDFTGRPLKGMVFVRLGDGDDAALDAWVRRGLAFTTSLPPK